MYQTGTLAGVSPVGRTVPKIGIGAPRTSPIMTPAKRSIQIMPVITPEPPTSARAGKQVKSGRSLLPTPVSLVQPGGEAGTPAPAVMATDLPAPPVMTPVVTPAAPPMAMMPQNSVIPDVAAGGGSSAQEPDTTGTTPAWLIPALIGVGLLFVMKHH